MSTRQVRPASGQKWVLVLSEMHHGQPNQNGRKCGCCHAVWKCSRDRNEDFHVTRNKEAADAAILDWHGNNVCVECCCAKMFTAFDREAENDAQQALLVVDIGYSAKRSSCGLCWGNAPIERTFGDAVATAAEVILDLKNPLLVIEAPLSTHHTPGGNPAVRGDFEAGRGWYHGAGATTCLAAMRFLDQLEQRLRRAGLTEPVMIAEAFLSDKDTATGDG